MVMAIRDGKVTRSPLQAIEDDQLDRLARYWQHKRVSARLPARGDIDPTEFPWLVGRVFLIDVLRKPVDFRFRLFGSELAAWYGVDLTGRVLSALKRPNLEHSLRSDYQGAVDTGEPRYREATLATRLGGSARLHRLVLPLAADGLRVDMILGASVLSDQVPDQGIFRSRVTGRSIAKVWPLQS